MDVTRIERRIQQIHGHIVPNQNSELRSCVEFQDCTKQKERSSFHSKVTSNVSLLDDEEYIEHKIHDNGCLQISLARKSALNAITYRLFQRSSF